MTNKTTKALELAEPEITTPDVCGEVCARAKLCYGCGKALDEANAKLAEPYACEAGECPDKSLCAGACECLFKAEPVQQEPVAWTNYNGAVNNRLKAAPVQPVQEPVSILDDPAFSVDVEYFEARKQALLNVAAKCDARRWIYLNRLNDMYFMPCENKDEPTNRVVFETTPDEAYDIGFSDGLEVGRKQRGEG